MLFEVRCIFCRDLITVDDEKIIGAYNAGASGFCCNEVCRAAWSEHYSLNPQELDMIRKKRRAEIVDLFNTIIDTRIHTNRGLGSDSSVNITQARLRGEIRYFKPNQIVTLRNLVEDTVETQSQPVNRR